jgi:chemotaxis protein methyltransferase CheR
MAGIPLCDLTFRDLRDYIYDHTGIYVPDTKKYFLENRLARRLLDKEFSSFEDYLRFVRAQGNGELKSLYDAVTTNETYFFREPQHFDIFTSHILPQVLERKRNRSIKVWSAACSTGEEPYTIAMILRENAFGIRGEVVGSDISSAALESARRGIYTSYAVRNVPPACQRKYFRVNDSAYTLDEEIRKSVKFLNVNLIDEKEVGAIRDADVIFCRNVLIYFDDKAKRKAVSLLYDALAPHGVLLVGVSESLHNVTRALKPTVIDKVVIYQKAAS